ncbi:MAG TPA: hypothetical protein VIE63_11835 [Ramlibacter sp.]|jgi:hypothetical protein
MRRVASSIAFTVLAACALTAGAQQMTKDGKRIGTRDEYRACLNDAETVEHRQADLRARSDKIAQQMKALSDEAPELAAAVKSADDDGLTGFRRTRLERRVKEHDEHLKAAQDDETKLNADVADLNKFTEAYRGRCTNVAFDNDDVAAVKKEREAAGKK